MSQQAPNDPAKRGPTIGVYDEGTATTGTAVPPAAAPTSRTNTVADTPSRGNTKIIGIVVAIVIIVLIIWALS